MSADRDEHRPTERPSPGALAVVGALHVDELVWPLGPLVAHASNPVRRERRVGGVGANVARTAARHGGRDVVMIAALGDDPDAAWLAASLAADGVDVRPHAVRGRASGRYTVVHDERGELFVGLADTAVAETLDAVAVRARLADTPLAALVLDANLGPACLAALVARTGIRGATDTAAGGERRDSIPRVALAVSPAKAARLAPLLPGIDLLLCNRREAAALGGIDPGAPIDALGDALVALGNERFVLSDGAAAVLVHTPGDRTLVPVPPLAVAASVNGAGDALAGATLARWLDDGDLVGAVRDAGLPAAAAVVRGGADAARAAGPDTPETR